MRDVRARMGQPRADLVMMVLAASLIAIFFYLLIIPVFRRSGSPRARVPCFISSSYNKWYFDELYDFIFVRPAKWLGRQLWKHRRRPHHRRFWPRRRRPHGVLDMDANSAVRLQSGYRLSLRLRDAGRRLHLSSHGISSSAECAWPMMPASAYSQRTRLLSARRRDHPHDPSGWRDEGLEGDQALAKSAISLCGLPSCDLDFVADRLVRSFDPTKRRLSVSRRSQAWARTADSSTSMGVDGISLAVRAC